MKLQFFRTLIILPAILGSSFCLCETAQALVMGHDFTELVKKLKPAVVNISAAKIPGPQDDDSEHQSKGRNLGSGFIISDDGYILTNNHIIAGSNRIKVKLFDGRVFTAELKGTDAILDLALIKIKAEERLPIAPLGDSSKLEVGEWAIAIGNPFGLTHSVTAGIVSATGRVIGNSVYDDFIQTDAAINPGNSGGPLINARGEVVGINSAMIAGGQGLGFAIPVNIAKTMLPELKKNGRAPRAWLGVTTQVLTSQLARSFGLKDTKGTLIADVEPNSPAEKAGLKSGDIILEFNRKRIHEMLELSRLFAATEAGKTVSFKIFRDGRTTEVSLTVLQLTKESREGKKTVFLPEFELAVREIDNTIASNPGLDSPGGLLVLEVNSGGVGEEAGIRKGDIVKDINGTAIRSLNDKDRAIAARKPHVPVRLLLRRGDSSHFVALEVDER